MKFGKIFDHFPVPEFLNFPFAGISITDSAVHCIQFSKGKNGLTVKKYGQKHLTPGTMVSGQINNSEELVRVLSELKKELSLEYVKVALPEEKGYLFTAKIPMVSNKEVVSAIETKIEENVPVPPLELLFDYTLSVHTEEQHLDVVVSALPIAVVDTFVDLFEKAELPILSLEIESQATVRALFPKNHSITTLVVQFSKEKVGLYVALSGVVRFTSTVALPGQSGYGTGTDVSDLEFLSREVRKLYTYWHTLKENKDRPDRLIGAIVVCGEDVDRVARYLSTNNGTQSMLGNAWTNVLDVQTTVPEISFADSLQYVTAIGLALPSEVLI